MSDRVRVVPEDKRSPGPPQGGMIREEAVASDRLWAGLVRTEPNMSSGWHHHGDHETVIYVISGRVRMEFGPGGRNEEQAGPHDFIHIPQGAIHRESNPMDQEATVIVVRAGSGETVVNVDGPEADY